MMRRFLHLQSGELSGSASTGTSPGMSKESAEQQSVQLDGLAASPAPGHVPNHGTSESPGPFGLIHVGRGSFGDAIRAAKAGLKVARSGWNGAGMYAVIMPGYEKSPLPARTAKIMGVPEGTEMAVRPYWALKTAQDDIASWSPSGSDSLADDWCIVN